MKMRFQVVVLVVCAVLMEQPCEICQFSSYSKQNGNISKAYKKRITALMPLTGLSAASAT
jgi:hypothetical protein